MDEVEAGLLFNNVDNKLSNLLAIYNIKVDRVVFVVVYFVPVSKYLIEKFGLPSKDFMAKYYKGNIPLIDNKEVYNCIKKAYYGGMTEVYRPYGENLYYYDVNSLYPYVALNDMPGCECRKEYFFDYKSNSIDIHSLFGFYYVEVECLDERYLGLLPFRGDKTLLFPTGK